MTALLRQRVTRARRVLRGVAPAARARAAATGVARYVE